MLTLWNLFGAPLMIGGELTKLSDEELRMLTNKELLALNDGKHFGRQILRDETTAIWENTDCEEGYVTVALFNLSDEDGSRSISLEELGIEGDNLDGLQLHELWDKTNHKLTGGRITAAVPAHGVKVYRLIG